MKKVVVNKNFNKYYLNKYIERIMDFNGTSRENDVSYKYRYNDILVNPENRSYATISKYILTNSYGLSVIDKTQNFIALDTDVSTFKTDGKENLLYSLISTNRASLNEQGIKEFMFNRGIITEDEKTKSFISTIDNIFDPIVPVYKNYKYIEDDVVTFRNNIKAESLVEISTDQSSLVGRFEFFDENDIQLDPTDINVCTKFGDTIGYYGDNDTSYGLLSLKPSNPKNIGSQGGWYFNSKAQTPYKEKLYFSFTKKVKTIKYINKNLYSSHNAPNGVKVKFVINEKETTEIVSDSINGTISNPYIINVQDVSSKKIFKNSYFYGENGRIFKLNKQASIGTTEDLFLVVFAMETPKFSKFEKYIGVGVEDVVKYPFMNFDGRQRLSYLAFELGTPSNPKDINYDKLDKITHLDSIELKIALPKEIIMKY